ncbi:siderophore synthetase component [Shewanella psychrophila]|uniref:Siderophore synthetase component n=1 Tax=Shewanella psychrophila TaxID=225848 RepID=A0A1S6HYM6_9GAMM|nr:IucA/IucC family protein [Shewanella psychrophila]AQS40660.1 siderophore synthetase component [Shewanella psychrophila]
MSLSQSYICQRIIDTCLRENVCELMSQGSVIKQLASDKDIWPEAQPQAWLEVSHLGTKTLYIPLTPSDYMQEWRAVSPAWLTQEVPGASLSYVKGYRHWLETLSSGLTQEERALFSRYIHEADCASEQDLLCRQAYQQQKQGLSAEFTNMSDWHHQLLFGDQLAAYLDHPYYPTARAKVGFDADALTRYAPEFAPRFELNWLAIEKSLVSLTSTTPDCWPSFSDVGLDIGYTQSHQLFPLHPLTLAGLPELPLGILIAPKSAITVQPTLSVRTLALVDFPGVHIKVPLMMATLGAKNIRSIKPSTIYDGHWFEQTLTELAENDPQLTPLFEHVDEQHGGHMGERKEFAYIVRSYPLSMQDKHLVAVAALASEMPDGRLYLSHLADSYYGGDSQAWLTQYLSLLLKVHLRLWLKYGIALESNQQNAVIAYKNSSLSLVMKDNDSARLLARRYQQSAQHPQRAEQRVTSLLDRRILVEDDEALAQMFTTITLQLDIAAIIEAMASKNLGDRKTMYRHLRQLLLAELDALDRDGVDTEYARHYLLGQTYLPIKYLLSSGSLLSKASSGASDVNKFYGHTAPNFLSERFLCE